jgi:hypothetical protein
MFDRDGRTASSTRTGPANRSASWEYPVSVASTDRATTPDVSSHALLQIINPPPGHPGFVGIKHAQRWVKQGRAVLVGDGRLTLLERHRRQLARGVAERPGAVGYDHVRRPLTSGEKRRLPIAQPPERPTKRKMVAALARPGIVRFRYEMLTVLSPPSLLLGPS